MKIPDEEFESFVTLGIESLPEWVQEKIQNVAFIIEDEPSPAYRKEHGLQDGETLFGLYEGVPLTLRGEHPPTFPDRIIIFKKPILAAYETVDAVKACVANTIWHEVAHYFGHGEDWVEKEEEKRGKHL